MEKTVAFFLKNRYIKGMMRSMIFAVTLLTVTTGIGVHIVTAILAYNYIRFIMKLIRE